MVLGIGTDVLEIRRIEKAAKKPSFVHKIYTNREIQYFDGLSRETGRFSPKAFASMAGNFAAKEAVSKAFGTGFRGFSPQDIEILRSENGKPYVNVYNGALAVMEKANIQTIHISIAHGNDLAVAYAITEGERL